MKNLSEIPKLPTTRDKSKAAGNALLSPAEYLQSKAAGNTLLSPEEYLLVVDKPSMAELIAKDSLTTEQGLHFLSHVFKHHTELAQLVDSTWWHIYCAVCLLKVPLGCHDLMWEALNDKDGLCLLTNCVAGGLLKVFMQSTDQNHPRWQAEFRSIISWMPEDIYRNEKGPLAGITWTIENCHVTQQLAGHQKKASLMLTVSGFWGTACKFCTCHFLTDVETPKISMLTEILAESGLMDPKSFAQCHVVQNRRPRLHEKCRKAFERGFATFVVSSQPCFRRAVCQLSGAPSDLAIPTDVLSVIRDFLVPQTLKAHGLIKLSASPDPSDMSVLKPSLWSHGNVNQAIAAGSVVVVILAFIMSLILTKLPS